MKNSEKSFKSYMRYQKISAKEFNNFMIIMFFFFSVISGLVAVFLVSVGYDSNDAIYSIIDNENYINMYLFLHMKLALSAYTLILYLTYHVLHLFKWRKE